MTETTEAPNLTLVQGFLSDEKAVARKIHTRLDSLNDALGEAWELEIDIKLHHKKQQIPLSEGLLATLTVNLV